MALDQTNDTHALLVRAAKALYEYAQTLPISKERDQALIDSTALETLAQKDA